MVFQDYALYPHMSVRANLEFPLRMRKLAPGERERRVAWAAGLLDLEPVLERLPKELSGGQRQRVAMGRALVREPAAFLLDEPLSNLDPKLRVQVRAEIAELQHRTGTTMIYVTHDQTEAMTLGRRVAVLHRGRLQQVATPRVLYERPANTFVAGFIGTPPMNLFETRLRLDGDPLLVLGDQTLRLSKRFDPAMLPAPGTALIAGVRPEGLQPARGGGPSIATTLEQIEYLGHETLAHVRVGRDASSLAPMRWIARVQGRLAESPGTLLRLQVDEDGLYLFARDGCALALDPVQLRQAETLES
jgi:ABC-type sugar transport system ATPase subunit